MKKKLEEENSFKTSSTFGALDFQKIHEKRYHFQVLINKITFNLINLIAVLKYNIFQLLEYTFFTQISSFSQIISISDRILFIDKFVLTDFLVVMTQIKRLHN